jgi:hypothetical protein
MSVIQRLIVAAATGAVLVTIATPVSAQPGSTPPEPLTGRQVFPVTNWWNADISQAPVDARSAALIGWISGRVGGNVTATRSLHPDFGPPPYGMPYVVTPGTQPRVPLTFVEFGSESDPGAAGAPPGYPIPPAASTQPNYIEGGAPGSGGSGDRHMLIIDRDRWLLFEIYHTHWNGSGWQAGSGAVFDLAADARRPEGWTSADAAGLAIFPGLVRYDEAAGTGEIRHAFRFTTRSTNGYVWPASHNAGATAGAPPMGTRLRLKASKNLSSYTPAVQRIFRAMQTYGLILADNGTDMYISGTMDARWNNDDLNPAFGSLTADDFEVITLGWRPAVAPNRPTGLRIIPDP